VGSEGLYVYYGAYPTFKYYAPEYDLENGNVFIGKASRSKPGRYQVELDSITGLGNVWFLFAHNCHWCKVDEQEYFLRYLDKKGTRLGEVIHPGGSAYYYRFEP
jgi:hypothetical protein